MRYKILKIAFIIWLALWVFFTARELFLKNGHFYDYKELLSRSLDGKRSYVTGDEFYKFLVFCNEKLPRGSIYEWVGIEEGDLAKRRAAYYLYPHLEKKDAEFILIYDKPGFGKDGYKPFAALDERRYLIKKEK